MSRSTNVDHPLAVHPAFSEKLSIHYFASASFPNEIAAPLFPTFFKLPLFSQLNYTICFRSRPQQAVPTYPQAKVPVVRAMI